jgi:formamidopyrimidine-DNA glycosylase
MPEAPEVQTVLSTLETQIKDVSIEDVLIYYPKIIDNVEVETFKNQLIGQTFHSFNRLGKYLIFGLDDYDLVVHLRMEGKFYLYNMLCENNHIHIVEPICRIMTQENLEECICILKKKIFMHILVLKMLDMIIWMKE